MNRYLKSTKYVGTTFILIWIVLSYARVIVSAADTNIWNTKDTLVSMLKNVN